MATHRRWDVLVGEMIIRRTALAEASAGRVFGPSTPGPRATKSDIAGAEARLGHQLDAHHAALLREGNGYVDVFGFGDLLSTDDLGQGDRWAQAQEFLLNFYEFGPLDGSPLREGLYPFHVGDEDVYVIDMGGARTDGGHPVLRLADQLVDQWPNAYEYWLAGLTTVDRFTARMAAEPR